MNTSPFDPRVKQSHSRLQAMVLLGLRHPLSKEAEQDARVEEDAEYADARDEATMDEDYDIFAEEGFDVD